MTSHNMAAGEFKAKCLKVLDEVAESGQPVTITKRGQPVARVVPIPTHRKLFGAMKHSVVAQHGIIDPVDDAWEADA